MPRPTKCRRVEYIPGVKFFKPAGIPMRTLDEILLSFEEVEAIRLKDVEGLEQEKAAERMSISRPTFQRVLASGRKKLADALMNGKAIRIEGGIYAMASSRYRCNNGHEWDVTFEEMANTPPELCPTCDTTRIEPVSTGGRGRRYRGRYGHK